MTTSQPLTQLEQEVFEYLNDTPNIHETRRESVDARISYEFGIRFSEAHEIVSKWETYITFPFNKE